MASRSVFANAAEITLAGPNGLTEPRYVEGFAMPAVMKQRPFLALLVIAILLLAVGGWSAAALRAPFKP